MPEIWHVNISTAHKCYRLSFMCTLNRDIMSSWVLFRAEIRSLCPNFDENIGKFGYSGQKYVRISQLSESHNPNLAIFLYWIMSVPKQPFENVRIWQFSEFRSSEFRSFYCITYGEGSFCPPLCSLFRCHFFNDFFKQTQIRTRNEKNNSILCSNYVCCYFIPGNVLK